MLVTTIFFKSFPLRIVKTWSRIKGENAGYHNKVFHDPLVSLNFEGFDPQIVLNDPQNLQFTFFISYEGGHCDPLNRKLRENPATIFSKSFPLRILKTWSRAECDTILSTYTMYRHLE